MKKVAVILSGCGVYDGSEIHEACAALLALNRANAEAVVCAPVGPQMHVINHLTGDADNRVSRDIFTEAARIARGEIQPLAQVNPGEMDAVLLPGGFGAAKNLCTFAVDGANCTVNPEVEGFLREMQASGKPIGAMCIAPVILARIFGRDLQPSLTIGNDPGTAEMVNDMGAVHVDCLACESVVDPANKLVTTPAYLRASNISDVFTGAEGFVEKLLDLCR